MPLDKLIDLLAEAAVRKLSQEREAKDATSDAMTTTYEKVWRWSYHFRNLSRYILQARHPCHSPKTRRP